MDQKDYSQKMATVIIPAFNEEQTIAKIIKTALESQYVDEVVVIDDGSKDDTYNISVNTGAYVFKFEKNMGKAQAMQKGVNEAKNNVICFLDADLIGLTPDHISTIIKPVLNESVEMNISIRKRKGYIVNKLLRIFPLLGGERAITKKLWSSVPTKYKKRFEIEIALNYFAKKFNFPTHNFYMPGIKQTIKEKKHGFFRGLLERILMIIDILIISFELYIIDQTSTFFSQGKKHKVSKQKLNFNFKK